MALVILSGALANKPFNGGNAWSRLSWILGFKSLGFEVCFVEQIGRDSCIDSAGQICPFESSVNLAYFRHVMADFGLQHSCSLIYRDGEQVWGLTSDQLKALGTKACLLFNFSGHLTLASVREKVDCKIYYDDDPGFTQYWHAAHNPAARLWDHDFHFTIGENIGKPGCPIPTEGIEWRHTRPPVALDHWPAIGRDTLDRFTTVASWRGAYGPVQYQGKTYGLKVHEFRKLIDLPQRSRQAFELALQIHPADRKDLDALIAYGWHVTDPVQVAGTPEAFQRYVQGSGAEFSVAQGVYVETHSGWFSDRTVRYLASGKPALVQDTGFADNYPATEGLIPFRNITEAIEGADRIATDYPRHCRAARRFAEEYFDARQVVHAMADEVGLKIP